MTIAPRDDLNAALDAVIGADPGSVLALTVLLKVICSSNGGFISSRTPPLGSSAGQLLDQPVAELRAILGSLA
jgi:hypothetical protein